jgi:hypothetical protein
MSDYFSKLAKSANDNKAKLPMLLVVALAACGKHTTDIHYEERYDLLRLDPEHQDDLLYHAPENAIFTDADYSTYGDVIVIHEGMGGYVTPIIGQYTQWADEGKYLVIDGQVASADAFGAFSEMLEGQVCYTENAVFSPHAASYGIDDPDPEGTEELATMLVDPLEREFRISPFFNDIEGVAEIGADRLSQIYPQGECAPDKVAYTRREPNF